MADSQKNSLADRDAEQAITALKKGAYLLKYGRRGKPKFCPFRLSTDESALLWYHGKEERELELRSVSRIIPGQRTAIFQRYPRPEKEYQSFSLIYNDRSLDLICKDKDEAEVWFVGLKALISRGGGRHSKTEGRIENLHSDSSNHKRIYPCIPLEHVESPQVENLPQSRLGKAFSDIIALTAANKVQSQSELSNTSSNKFQNQSEHLVSSHSSPPSISVDTSSNARSSTTENSRSSTTENSRISLSSAVSSSSHGSYREDFEALGDVLIWGEGAGDGILGGGIHKIGSSLGNMIDSLLPKSLESTTVLDVHNIACGSKHAMLVSKQGEIFSWGEEEGGRLGHGIEEDISQPKVINSLSGTNVEYVACGENHSCAVTVSGDLYTWGDGTYRSGLLGHGSSSSHGIPRKVYGLMDGVHVSHISCGPWHTAVVTSTGQLYTFGDGTFGALGHGDRTSTGTPREVETLRGLRTLKAACGVWHTAAVVEVMTGEEETIPLGKLFTWGDGDKGQLGHGDKETSLVPKCIADTDDVSFCQVACGHSLTVTLTSSGRVYTMGSRNYGQLGNPLANGFVPTCVEETIGHYFVEEIACGSNHVAVLTSKAEVYTWGKGANGQLGHGDCKDRNVPTLVSSLKDKQVKKVFCGSNFTAAIHLHKLASTADNSMCSGCRNPFNFRRRRHNCYNCGLVFCKACSSRRSLKASLAPAMNKPYRVCDDCFNKLKKVSENGYVGQIAKVQSKNSLTRYNETTEKDGRNPVLPGQLSMLSSDSLNRCEGKSFNLFTKDDMNDNRLFPNANGSIERRSISLKSSSIGAMATKNLLASSPTGSKVVSHTPTPVSKWSIATLASSLLARPLDVSLEESKQNNEKLSEEVVNLKAQVQDLTSRYQILEAELDVKEKKLKEATELAANEAEKCKAAKEVIKSLTAQLKEMLEKVSEGTFGGRQVFGDPNSPSSHGHVVKERFDSVARKDSGDPSSHSSERHVVDERLDSVARQDFGAPSSPSSEGHNTNKRLDFVAGQGSGHPNSPSPKGHKVNNRLESPSSNGHIVRKKLDPLAIKSYDHHNSPSSNGHISNERLNSVAKQGFGDPAVAGQGSGRPISPSPEEHKVNKRLDSPSINGHIVKKELDPLAIQSYDHHNSPSSNGHMSNEKLNPVAKQAFGDPSVAGQGSGIPISPSPGVHKVNQRLESPSSNGHIVKKKLDPLAIQSHHNSPSSNGHISNERLNSVAKQGSGDPSVATQGSGIPISPSPGGHKVNQRLESPSSNGHIVNKKLDPLAIQSYDHHNLPTSNGHISNERLNSVAKQGFGDPSSHSTDGHIVNKRLDSVTTQNLGDPSPTSAGHTVNEKLDSVARQEANSPLSEGHTVDKRVDSAARQSFGDPNSSSSNGHITNKRLNSVAINSSGDPISPSSKGHIVNKRLESVASQEFSFPNPSSSKGHTNNKSLDSVARNSFGDPNSPSSKGHVVNKRLESVARQDFSNPGSPSFERNGGRSHSPKSESANHSRNSSNGTKAPNDKAEYVVQDEPGVYITLFHLGDGQNELKRVRFSRKKFTEEQAENWWAENAIKVCERHNIQTA